MPDQPSTSRMPNRSEDVGKIQNHSAQFGNIPNDSENVRIFRNLSEHKENHTLTIREVTRMFETAGVSRTERSIVNWCQPNKTGVARLDAYFDPNERKYFITLQSVKLAIEEEKSKASKAGGGVYSSKTVPNDAEGRSAKTTSETESNPESVKDLNQEIFDLKITNRAKDMFIEQMKKERDDFIQQIVAGSRKIGELETRLLQLEAPEQ